MKYEFDKTKPYEFKYLTGIAPEDKIGDSIVVDDQVVGGIRFDIGEVPIPPFFQAFFPKEKPKVVNILGIELLPEHRNKGIGSAIVNDFINKYECLNAAVQEEQAWKWWKKMGAKEYMAIYFPEDEGKEDPRVHTMVFVLAREEMYTMAFKNIFQMATTNIPGSHQAKTTPKIDFSQNK